MKTRLVLVFCCCLAPVALAQEAGPPPAGAPAQARPAPPPPKNLQVLPADIPRAELIAKMREYAGALGVTCAGCHVENPETHRVTDFAADDNRHKATARRMITMVQEINAKYFTRPGSDRPPAISCGNCHQGHERPQAFVPPPPAPPAGAAPAAAPAPPSGASM